MRGLLFVGFHKENSRDLYIPVRSWSENPLSSSQSECTGWLPLSFSQREKKYLNTVRVTPDMLA